IFQDSKIKINYWVELANNFTSVHLNSVLMQEVLQQLILCVKPKIS
ncbi:unnamed protein product, partial [Rotaria sp. Silwood1]